MRKLKIRNFKLLNYCSFASGVLFIFISSSVVSQTHDEIGYFDINNYSSKQYHAKPQNWAILQDKRGLMYFGNNDGVLEYDGKNWELIKTEKATTVRSLAIDKKGTIYVGATGEFGFLAADRSGKLKYVSLLVHLQKKDLDFADIWKTITNDKDEVYFQASNKIFRWDGKSIKVWDATKSFHFMFDVNGTLYVRQREIGLMSLQDSDLVLIHGKVNPPLEGSRGASFADEKIYFMIPFAQNQVLLNTRSHGLFKMNKEEIIPFATQVDNFFSGNLIYDAIRTSENNYSIGTLGAGIAVIDSSGNLIKSTDKNTGLQDGSVYYQYLDTEENLWLALNNGISKVSINSPITKFNDRHGLEGIVQSITRHNNILYVATNLGVFYLETPINTNQSGSKGPNQNSDHSLLKHPTFKKLKEIEAECWDLLSLDIKSTSTLKKILLVATNAGVFQIENNKPVLICKGNATVIYRSQKDHLRVFIGLADGMSSLYWENGKWKNEGNIKDINEDIRSMAEEKNGDLWLGTNGTGVLKLHFALDDNPNSNIAIERYDQKDGFAREILVYVHEANGKIYFASTKGLYKFIPEQNKKGYFRPDSSLGSQFSDTITGIHRLIGDRNNNIWMESFSTVKQEIALGYVEVSKNSNSTKWQKTPFMGISKEIIHAIYPDENGITWLGGPDGLFCYDNKIKKNYTQEFNALIRKVNIGIDSVIFSGTFVNKDNVIAFDQTESLKPNISFNNNSMSFYFAAPNFEDESANLYSHYLEGFDEKWSDWKNETKAVYTNLPEGKYFFKVKAKNIYANESKQASYEFSILPPWYRTVWAYLGYLFSFIGFVYGAIVFSTRGLRAIIKQHTAEIVKQKEVIEVKNKDITDSINYAKRIQEAILPTREYFKSLLPESFILFKPKDIVSGDFYWLMEWDNKILVAAADCTGHGVPGAFTSMIGSSLLNEIVNDKEITTPSKILDALRQGIIKALKQTGKSGESKDGMDIALCCIDLKNKKLEFAGAYNPLFMVRNNELIEVKGDKFPIGISDRLQDFANNEIIFQQGDTIYLFSDGFADQFGGPFGKKYMRKQFKEFFLSNQQFSMDDQKENLHKSFLEWQGNNAQIDDILVIGIRF